jgi:hypothetical protein
MQYDTHAALKDLRRQLRPLMIARGIRIVRGARVYIGPLHATRRLKTGLIVEINPVNSYRNIAQEKVEAIEEMFGDTRPVFLVALDVGGNLTVYSGMWRDDDYYLADSPLVQTSLAKPTCLAEVVVALGGDEGFLDEPQEGDQP